MPLFRNGSRIVLFVHVPKTGGTSVEWALRDSGAAQALKFNKRLGFSQCSPQHMDWKVLRAWVPLDFCDAVFCTVRAPLARLASEYRWRSRVGGKALPDFSTWIIESFAAYRTDPYLYDNHIRPQSDFIGPGVRVFRLEDGLGAPIRFGLDALGMDRVTPIPHHASRSRPTTLHLDPEVLARVHDFYAEDYGRLGYDRERDLPADIVIGTSPGPGQPGPAVPPDDPGF